MNKLQNLDIDKNIFVTLNPIQIPKENKIIKIFKYDILYMIKTLY